MAIKRYNADADNTITNAFKADLSTRGTGANMGSADVLEVFSIRGQASGSDAGLSSELSRAIIKFPVSDIQTDRSASTIPLSGSVSFYLRLQNAPHSRTVPENYTLIVQAISRSWQEGVGLDLDNYKSTTKGNIGYNWMSASKTVAWTHAGGDYLTASDQWDTSGNPPVYTQDFSTGMEDLEIDITGLVEHWVAGDLGNHGVGIMLSS